MRRPITIGLTGSIGMGKTTTAGLFREAGLPVWDADAAVARLYAPGGGGVAALSSLGRDVVAEDGGVSRDKLRAWIAEDPQALSRIEAVVHPLVAEDRARFLSETDAPAVVLDIPLLFETGGDAAVDVVVVVSTDPEQQRERVMARPGMTEARFEHLLSKQLPDADKRRRADMIVATDSIDSAREGVAAVLRKLGLDHA